MRKKTKTALVLKATFIFLTFSAGTSHAATSWVKPIFGLKEAYDDNIFLTETDESDDFVTTLAAGIAFDPQLNDHEFTANYIMNAEMFAEYSDQNTINQAFDMDGTLHFNDWRVEAGNLFRRYEERSGSEDTARVPRSSDWANVKLIRVFNDLEVGLNYAYGLEDYRSDASIGSYDGRDLTYQDLDSDENSGELELAFQFWPKTSFLFSGRYGALTYDTGRKSDSEYFDVLTGLRGRFFARGEIEGKVGYRTQDYEDPASDFSGVIFRLSLSEKFSEKDALTIDFDRTTSASTYQQNAYFESTSTSCVYAHDFNNRMTGKISGAYVFNTYPTETTEGAQTAKREDDLWQAGIGLGYKLPRYTTIELEYFYSQKSSNFVNFGYQNNRVSASMQVKF